MKAIGKVEYLPTPFSLEDMEYFMDMWFVFGAPVLLPPTEPGVFIIQFGANGFSRWIPNSWYDEEYPDQKGISSLIPPNN